MFEARGLTKRLETAVLVTVLMASAPAAIAQGNLDTKELERFLDSIMAEHAPAGAAITVVQNGAVILEKGYGFADAEKQVPVHPDLTMFRVGSVSKSVTATAVMQLLERGLLQLDPT